MPTADNHPLTTPRHDTRTRPPAPGRHSRPTALRTIARALAYAALTVLVGLTAAAIVVPRIIGAVPLTVVSGSMEPTLSPGDLVVVVTVEPTSLAVGDVVTFQPEPGNPALVTHRIVGITVGGDDTTGFLTQGDANSVADPPILVDQVMGRVLYSLPLVGYVTALPWGMPVVAAATAGLAAYGVATGLASRRAQETGIHA